MGNNQPGRGEQGVPAMKSKPLLYHTIHSENIQISPDRRKAKRIESFCKGICFTDRPIAINERVYIKFAEISTSWSGVVRFGFMSHNPTSINPADLPRYACPDLTNKPGFWAKALPERFAEVGTVLLFYLTRGGDVMFGVNGEEKGVFFSGISTSSPLWGLVDIYGNTTAMEFVGGEQQYPAHSELNNLPLAPIPTPLPLPLEPARTSLTPQIEPPPPALPPHTTSQTYLPIPFHSMVGRNISLSPDKLMAVRHHDEYCNGYVFTSRPMHCGEKLAIQILAVDKTFRGGVAFGMTSCDPCMLSSPDQLPDDSDLLLDRPEYWVVNKDVCTNPEVGDELSFKLTEEGEVVYFRNEHQVATLMHVDKTLPMWAFVDVYGSCQQIQCLGMMVPRSSGSLLRAATDTPPQPSLTVALPPPRSSQSSPATSITPPPRPPPPRSSPSGRTSPPHTSHPPPTLPPKQHRVGSSSPRPSQPPPPAIPHSLPPPLIPTPSNPAPTQDQSLPPRPPPAIPQRPSVVAPAPAESRGSVAPAESRGSVDGSGECAVCLDRPVDCVIYTCGHMCACYQCAQDMKDSRDGSCPICRQPIKDIIKIFRS